MWDRLRTKEWVEDTVEVHLLGVIARDIEAQAQGIAIAIEISRLVCSSAIFAMIAGLLACISCSLMNFDRAFIIS